MMLNGGCNFEQISAKPKINKNINEKKLYNPRSRFIIYYSTHKMGGHFPRTSISEGGFFDVKTV